MTHCCVIDLPDVVDRVPGSSGEREKLGDNAEAACESRLQLRCM